MTGVTSSCKKPVPDEHLIPHPASFNFKNDLFKHFQQVLQNAVISPVSVILSLCVQKLQQCFESRDIGMLQQAVLDMPKEEAEYHIKRCIDSGLWVPSAGDLETRAADAEGEGAEGAVGGSKDIEEEEELYEQVD